MSHEMLQLNMSRDILVFKFETVYLRAILIPIQIIISYIPYATICSKQYVENVLYKHSEIRSTLAPLFLEVSMKFNIFPPTLYFGEL